MSDLSDIFSENKKKNLSRKTIALISAGICVLVAAVVAVIVLCVGGDGDTESDSSNDAPADVIDTSKVNTLNAPSLVGKTWDEALEASISPIKPVVIYDANSTAPYGQITAQHPDAGTLIYCDGDGVCRAMEITVSSRDFSTEYKSLIGRDSEEAMAWLVECGVKKENVQRVFKASTTGVGNGCVSAFTYAHGGSVPEGTVLGAEDKLIMTVNSYSDSVTVPALGGKSFEQAVELLYQSKLNVGEISYEDSGFDDGTVLSQTPVSGGTAYYGDKIDLVLSTYADKFEMPSLLGLTLEEAEKLLDDAGLILGAVTSMPTEDYPDGTVCLQSVQAGEGVYAATVVDVCLAENAEESSEEGTFTVTLSYNADSVYCEEGELLTVVGGESATVHITALEGYVLESVTVNGIEIDGVAGKSSYIYVLPAVFGDCDIVITAAEG